MRTCNFKKKYGCKTTDRGELHKSNGTTPGVYKHTYYFCCLNCERYVKHKREIENLDSESK